MREGHGPLHQTPLCLQTSSEILMWTHWRWPTQLDDSKSFTHHECLCVPKTGSKFFKHSDQQNPHWNSCEINSISPPQLTCLYNLWHLRIKPIHPTHHLSWLRLWNDILHTHTHTQKKKHFQRLLMLFTFWIISSAQTNINFTVSDSLLTKKHGSAISSHHQTSTHTFHVLLAFELVKVVFLVLFLGFPFLFFQLLLHFQFPGEEAERAFVSTVRTLKALTH